MDTIGTPSTFRTLRVRQRKPPTSRLPPVPRGAGGIGFPTTYGPGTKPCYGVGVVCAGAGVHMWF